MTEKEWLEQSDDEKNFWILYKTGHRCRNGLWWKGDLFLEHHAEWVLNWQGFGLIVEKLGRFALHVRHEGLLYIFVKFSNYGEYLWQVEAPTPWEAAALAKMRSE